MLSIALDRRGLRTTTPSLPSGYLPRPRLHSLLTRGLVGRRLTTIVAPPGHGKTTLIAGWLAELRAGAVPWQTAWLSLDADTAAPRPFLHALIDAIRRPFPAAAPNFRASLDSTPTAPLLQLGEMLRHGLSGLPGRLLLVIDNAEFIERSQLISLIQGLVADPSIPLHLVLISHDSLQQFAVGRGQLTRLTVDDLLFGEDEVAAWLRCPPGDKAARLLHQFSGGRAIGLSLARALPLDDDERARFLRNRASLPWRTALEALLQTIATGLPDEPRQVWFAVALLGLADLELVSDTVALSVPAAADALELLVARGLLDQPAGPASTAYTIHPLVGLILIQGETPVFGPDTAQQMRRRAAAHLLARGEVGPALRQWAALGDREALAAAAESVLPDMERQERWADVHDLLLGLPPGLIDDSVALLMAHIWSLYFTTRKADIAPLISRADALLETAPLPLDQIAMLRAELELIRGLPSAIAERLARREQINDLITNLAQQRSRARAEALFGLYMSNRYTEENRELADRIEQELGEDGGRELSPMLRANLYSVLTGIYARHGPVDKLEAAGRAMLDAANETRSPNLIAWARVALGLSAFLRDDPPQAMIQLEEALYRSPQLGAGLVHFVISYLVPVYAQLGMTSRIPPAIEHAARIRASSPSLDRDWPAVEAFGLLHSGDLESAVAWVDETDHPAPETPLERRAVVVAEIRLAETRLAEGAPQGLAAALDYLDAYIDLIRAGHFTRNHTQALALRARLLWALGRSEDALVTFEQAIAMGHELGFDRFLLDGGPEMSEMLSMLAAHGRPQARELLARLRQVQAAYDLEESVEVNAGGLLTRREVDILRGLAIGRTNKEIGATLGISALTVRNHSARLFAKLGVSTRLEAVIRGRELGLLSERAPDAAAATATRIELTPMELRVLNMLAEDYRYLAIAEALDVSLNTVNSHIVSIYRKLGVNRRLSAVAAARRAGLLG